MAFSVVEWFAFVFAVLVIVKLVVISFNQKSWFNLTKSVYSSPMIVVLVELILAAVLFYYLLLELTIVQIYATIILGSLLMGLSFAIIGKETLAWAGKLYRQKGLMKKLWLPTLIWLILTVWTLVVLF